jgi:hypothetical protein
VANRRRAAGPGRGRGPLRFPAWFFAIGVLGACGGSSGPGTPSSPVPSSPPGTLGITETVTFTGAANPSCQGGGHTFVAAEGTVTLTLVETTDQVGLFGQVCGGNDNNACTVNQTRMAVGETLSGPRRGIASQTVKMLTLNCGTGPVPPAPVQYTIRLTYQR